MAGLPPELPAWLGTFGFPPPGLLLGLLFQPGLTPVLPLGLLFQPGLPGAAAGAPAPCAGLVPAPTPAGTPAGLPPVLLAGGCVPPPTPVGLPTLGTVLAGAGAAGLAAAGAATLGGGAGAAAGAFTAAGFLSSAWTMAEATNSSMQVAIPVHTRAMTVGVLEILIGCSLLAAPINSSFNMISADPGVAISVSPDILVRTYCVCVSSLAFRVNYIAWPRDV